MNPLPSSDRLYRDYKSRVLAYISARVPRPEDAEDLTGEVFVRLFRLMESYDENRASVSTLVYKLSHDIVIDWYRTRREFAELSEEQALLPSAEETVMDREKLAETRDALARLPQDQRDILILRFYRGWTLVRIAEEMGLPYFSVVAKKNKALDSIRRALGNRLS